MKQIVLLIDCPTLEFLPSLVNHTFWNTFPTELVAENTLYFFHTCPASVLNHTLYSTWLSQFSAPCKVINPFLLLLLFQPHSYVWSAPNTTSICWKLLSPSTLYSRCMRNLSCPCDILSRSPWRESESHTMPMPVCEHQWQHPIHDRDPCTFRTPSYTGMHTSRCSLKMSMTQIGFWLVWSANNCSMLL